MAVGERQVKSNVYKEENEKKKKKKEEQTKARKTEYFIERVSRCTVTD